MLASTNSLNVSLFLQAGAAKAQDPLTDLASKFKAAGESGALKKDDELLKSAQAYLSDQLRLLGEAKSEINASSLPQSLKNMLTGDGQSGSISRAEAGLLKLKGQLSVPPLPATAGELAEKLFKVRNEAIKDLADDLNNNSTAFNSVKALHTKLLAVSTPIDSSSLFKGAGTASSEKPEQSLKVDPQSVRNQFQRASANSRQFPADAYDDLQMGIKKQAEFITERLLLLEKKLEGRRSPERIQEMKQTFGDLAKNLLDLVSSDSLKKLSDYNSLLNAYTALDGKKSEFIERFERTLNPEERSSYSDPLKTALLTTPAQPTGVQTGISPTTNPAPQARPKEGAAGAIESSGVTAIPATKWAPAEIVSKLENWDYYKAQGMRDAESFIGESGQSSITRQYNPDYKFRGSTPEDLYNSLHTGLKITALWGLHAANHLLEVDKKTNVIGVPKDIFNSAHYRNAKVQLDMNSDALAANVVRRLREQKVFEKYYVMETSEQAKKELLTAIAEVSALSSAMVATEIGSGARDARWAKAAEKQDDRNRRNLERGTLWGTGGMMMGAGGIYGGMGGLGSFYNSGILLGTNGFGLFNPSFAGAYRPGSLGIRF